MVFLYYIFGFSLRPSRPPLCSWRHFPVLRWTSLVSSSLFSGGCGNVGGGASREISIDSCDLCVWPSCLPYSVHVIESLVYRQAHAVARLWRFVDVSRRVYSWANFWKIIHGIFKIYRYNYAPGSVFMGIIEKHKICVLKDSLVCHYWFIGKSLLIHRCVIIDS